MAFLVQGQAGLELQHKEKPMESMQECKDLIHQEEFTNNIVHSTPGAITVVFDCIERKKGQLI